MEDICKGHQCTQKNHCHLLECLKIFMLGLYIMVKQIVLKLENRLKIKSGVIFSLVCWHPDWSALLSADYQSALYLSIISFALTLNYIISWYAQLMTCVTDLTLVLYYRPLRNTSIILTPNYKVVRVWKDFQTIFWEPPRLV